MNTRNQIRACFENVACLARSGQNDKESEYIESMINIVMKKDDFETWYSKNADQFLPHPNDGCIRGSHVKTLAKAAWEAS